MNSYQIRASESTNNKNMFVVQNNKTMSITRAWFRTLEVRNVPDHCFQVQDPEVVATARNQTIKIINNCVSNKILMLVSTKTQNIAETSPARPMSTIELMTSQHCLDR